MKARGKFWPMAYVGFGVAAAIAGRTFITEATITLDPAVRAGMIYVVMPLLSVFLAIGSYFSLSRRSTHAHLAASMWSSSPMNPLSNQLAQIIGFGCVGLSVIAQQSNVPMRMFGWLGIWNAIALAVSLSLFRARNTRCYKSPPEPPGKGA
jgi:hypothetical protein